MAAHCDVAINNIEYEVTDAPEFKSDWAPVKPTLGMEFPNLPYLVDGDFKMSETFPILNYICDKWKPELLGKDAQHRATINMLASTINGFFWDTSMPFYAGADKESIAVTVQGVVDAKAPQYEKFLGDNKFLAGNEPCYVDFYFFEHLERMNWATAGKIFTDFPKLAAYHANFLTVKGVKEVNDQEKLKTFNNKMAVMNNTV